MGQQVPMGNAIAIHDDDKQSAASFPIGQADQAASRYYWFRSCSRSIHRDPSAIVHVKDGAPKKETRKFSSDLS
jgi:hypothetical protein